MKQAKMDEATQAAYLATLKGEIAPAMGCTEPAAVALAVAHAAAQLGAPVQGVALSLSRYIFKNGMNVGIPGTGLMGLPLAAALGAMHPRPEEKLMVLSGLTEAERRAAAALVDAGGVEIQLADTAEKIYIAARAWTAGGDEALAILSGGHTRLVRLEKNGTALVANGEETEKAAAGSLPRTPDMTLEEIFAFVQSVPLAQLGFLDGVLRMNRDIAQEGLARPYGLQVGKSLLDGGGLIAGDVANRAVALTAAAADARMAGCEMPVMSAAGSGNQGLTATLPVASIGWMLDKPEAAIWRAVALSILVTIHAKRYIGRLSVLCGCSIAAAIGACCGIILLMGGDLAAAGAGINNMVADISGVVCDGAKAGCALKIATAVQSAIRSANMALHGVGADRRDGIVASNAEKTLQNLGSLGNEGMGAANEVILGMMLANAGEPQDGAV